MCSAFACRHDGLPCANYQGKLKEWVSGKKLGAMTIPKELLDSTLAADLTMMKQEGK